MMIEYSDVSLCVEEQTVLSHVDFHVNDNEFVYIVGKVGSGKSTLLKSLYGEIPIASGEAKILGFDLCKLKRREIPPLRQSLGIVFQDFQLMHHLTVEGNLDFVLKATGWKAQDRPARIAQVLAMVGLEESGKKFPHELSGGEQQRICMARALLNSPRIILADEPTGNLDSETAMKIMDILKAAQSQGVAVVMVTHNLGMLSQVPGVVYECKDGGMVEITEKYKVSNSGEDAQSEEPASSQSTNQ